MALDAWLPVGHTLPDGAKARLPLFEGAGWQILETQGKGRALVARDELAQRWVNSGLLEPGVLTAFQFGTQRLWLISCSPSQILCPVSAGKSPRTKSEALAFSLALKATRAIDQESPLQDALYVEKISRLLPTYSISSRTDDAVILGYWLTGGANISVTSFRRLNQTLSWLGTAHLKEIVETAGFKVTEVAPTEGGRSDALHAASRMFELPGRPELAAFINEHIIDIVQNRDRYKALGIEFPSAVVLHGPPGCGKTFAVERLIDFLGWPSYQIDASSVASPYIHETSRKVAEV